MPLGAVRSAGRPGELLADFSFSWPRFIAVAAFMAGPLWRAATFVQRRRKGLLVGSCAGLFGAQISYHLLPDPAIQWLYQYWSRGRPAPLSPKLRLLFQEVLRDIGIPSGHRYEVFTTFTFYPVSAVILHWCIFLLCHITHCTVTSYMFFH